MSDEFQAARLAMRRECERSRQRPKQLARTLFAGWVKAQKNSNIYKANQ
jgi:hypothetical protein